MYVFEICAEGIFVSFPWWLENVKSRSKIALFANERHFEIWFPKERTITFFWSKLSKLHKKDPILHVATTFSLKQGETRTSHGPIPHPLRKVVRLKKRHSDKNGQHTLIWMILNLPTFKLQQRRNQGSPIDRCSHYTIVYYKQNARKFPQLRQIS